MMVSDRRRENAEPVRLPRAFWGAHGLQKTSYDLRAALGQAILEAVNENESGTNDERLLTWTHLVAVHHTANEEQVLSFLWELMRRRTKSAHFQEKFLLDARGNPQQAEKIRAALITQRRLVITSLDGHVLWEYPVADIVDTQVSLEARDYLMLVVRHVGYRSGQAVAPNWKKMICGSMMARDRLNVAVRKIVHERRLSLDTLHGFAPVIVKGRRVYASNRQSDPMVGGSSSGMNGYGAEGSDGKSVEMADLSNVGGASDGDGQFVEMKCMHHDTSADGKRGIFTSTKMPGREFNESSRRNEGVAKLGEGLDLSQELETVINSGKVAPRSEAVRSVYFLIVNELKQALYVRRAHMESGRWTTNLPKSIEANSIVEVEADVGDDSVIDILGSIVLTREAATSDGGDYGNVTEKSENVDECSIRFLNPMLAANAFTISETSWVRGTFKGGEKGYHAITVLTLSHMEGSAVPHGDNGGRGDNVSASAGGASGNIGGEGGDTGSSIIERKKFSKRDVEPLLFGRSNISPFPPTVTFEPPHCARREVAAAVCATARGLHRVVDVGGRSSLARMRRRDAV